MDYVGLANEIQERYRRYLRTTFYFRDPELRTSFREALDQGQIAKGPYIEATPPYRRGPAPAQFFPEVAEKELDQGFLRAIDGQRRLYRHQELALRRVAAGHNIVVATGTGSGKTECFLYPILLHLYRQFQEGAFVDNPGVRALVLYPMNALAYDQRERLGRLADRLEKETTRFRFSFGQYTGATPDTANDRFRHAGEILARRRAGELVLRQEMRTSPPHILLTNYSMLEYQLLRPQDSPLFDGAFGRTWTFLVLDEAHQYRGTRGNEMGLLLRRLKQRIRASGNQNRFRCIATSASLAGGEQDKPSIAAFAAKLFDEPFESDDIILAEVENLKLQGDARLPASSYGDLVRAIGSKDRTMIDAFDAPAPFAALESIEVEAGHILSKDQRLCELCREMEGGPKEVSQLASRLFPEIAEHNQRYALMDFTEALNRAAEPITRGPFLSIRYHLFLRALEGAFVQYLPNKQILLAPQGGEIDSGPAFELALCRECGQHYIVGRKYENKLTEAIRDPSRDDFGVSFFRPLTAEADYEGTGNVIHLCTRCRLLWRHGEPARCSHDADILVTEQPPHPHKPDQIGECVACEYSGDDPVREVIHGGDGPNAMIVTTLFERLDQYPKKILAFADSRQEAAYFAWYLEHTYRSILKRNVLYRSLASTAKPEERLSLVDVVDVYRRWYDRQGLFSETESRRGKLRKAGLDVLGEFLTPETRLSLSGVALISWSIRWPSALVPDRALTSPPWSLSPQDALTLGFLLIDSLRHDRAVELPDFDEVQLDWAGLGLQGSQRLTRLGPPHGEKGVTSWNGQRGWRTQFLSKILGKRGYSLEHALEIAERTLREVWAWLTAFSDRQPAKEQILVHVRNGRRLNPIWYRAEMLSDASAGWRCDTCNRFSDVSFEGVCPRYGCQGTLEAIEPNAISDNHYRVLYQVDLPGNMAVEEHTAQLTTDRGQEIQREFQEGRVNVLSCSTTFELGVDLGDLNAVFLRNVPPEAFNYAQRVGRAGRRAGSPGFAISYCRRAPHDLYYFVDPLRLISGGTKPPVVSLDNQSVADRHLGAVVLAAFFRHEPSRFEDKVEGLVETWGKPTLISAIGRFLREHQDQLAAALREIFPFPLHNALGIGDGSWIENFCQAGSRISRAQLEVCSDFERVDDLEERASAARDYNQARWAKDRKRTIASEDVLSFLSRKAVIPKYGFPVDVVELDTQPTRSAIDISLTRDLGVAIGEFAPTATLVASKREWQSFGLKKVPEKELDTKFYKVCQQHNSMVAWGEGATAVDLPCGDLARVRKYVIPSFGFITSNKPPREPTHRPTRLFTTRPYFLGSEATDDDRIGILAGTIPIATIWKAAPGQMAILCEGRSGRLFLICNACGAGFLARPPKGQHETAWGRECRGTLSPLP